MADWRNRVPSLGWTGWAAVGLLLTSCGQTRKVQDEPKPNEPKPNEPTPNEPTPNDVPATPRLLPWQLQAAGSAPLEVGIFDALRGVHCRFLPDAQGELRCLPLAPPALEVAGGYVDAGCTQPVYRALHLDDVAGVVGRPVALPLPISNCEQRYVVGKLRELTASDARFTGIPGSCRQFTPLELAAGEHDFAVEEVTSPSAWVRGREVDGPLVAERLRLRQFEAEGEQPFGARLLDEQWNRSCSLQTVAEQLVCVAPIVPATYVYYVDPECTGEKLWRADACSDAVYLGRPDALFGLGAVWRDPIFSQGKVCEPLRESEYASGDSFITQGAPVGLDALPTTTWTNEGSQRLQLRGLRAEDGSFIALPDVLFDSSSLRRYPLESHAPRFLDREIAESCAPVWTRDAGVRCVPQSTIVDPYQYTIYADRDCKELAYFCSDTSCPGEVVLMSYDANGEYRAVSRNRTVALAADATVYSSAGNACQEMAAGGPIFFKAGEVLPWDDYPELTELNGRASGMP